MQTVLIIIFHKDLGWPVASLTFFFHL